MEKRFMPFPGGVGVREKDGETTFVGRAVVYNSQSEPIYGCFREQILPGAFDESLADGHDIIADIDHDFARILGRRNTGTLKLIPGKDGIDVECTMGDYSFARDLKTAIARKDIPGMSFIFDVKTDNWRLEEGKRFRDVIKADMYEVAWVCFPAYPETTAGLRGYAPRAHPVEWETATLARMRRALGEDGPMDNMRRRIALWEKF